MAGSYATGKHKEYFHILRSSIGQTSGRLTGRDVQQLGMDVGFKVRSEILYRINNFMVTQLKVRAGTMK